MVGGEAGVTLSGACAVPERMQADADEALYAAKRAGRGADGSHIELRFSSVAAVLINGYSVAQAR